MTKYSYRIFRLRRTIIFGTFLAVGLVAIASVIASNRYTEILDLGSIFFWVTLGASAFMVSQAAIFPTAVGEILRIVWAFGLAVIVIAILSNFANPDQSLISGKKSFAIITTFSAAFFGIYYYLSKHTGRLLDFTNPTPFLYNRTIWIDRPPAVVFDAFSTKETNEHWNTQYTSVEKVSGEEGKYQICLRSVIWDDEEAMAKLNTVPIFAEVLAREAGVSEAIITYSPEAIETVESSAFVVIAENAGTRLSVTSSTTGFPLVLVFMVWLKDYYTDYCYHAKERIEGRNAIAIKSIPYQMYLLEWFAYRITKLNKDLGLDS